MNSFGSPKSTGLRFTENYCNSTAFECVMSRDVAICRELPPARRVTASNVWMHWNEEFMHYKMLSSHLLPDVTPPMQGTCTVKALRFKLPNETDLGSLANRRGVATRSTYLSGINKLIDELSIPSSILKGKNLFNFNNWRHVTLLEVQVVHGDGSW